MRTLSRTAQAIGLLCLAPLAGADISVRSQTNSLYAYQFGHSYEPNTSFHDTRSNASSSLLPYSDKVTAIAHGGSSAGITTAIRLNAISIAGSVSSLGWSNLTGNGYGNASAATSLTFQVTSNAIYKLTATLPANGGTATLTLFQEGAVVLKGAGALSYAFKTGHTYEIDCDASVKTNAFNGMESFTASYGFTLSP